MRTTIYLLASLVLLILCGCQTVSHDYSDFHEEDLSALNYPSVNFCLDVPPVIQSSGVEFSSFDLKSQMGNVELIGFDDNKYFVPTLESFRKFNYWAIKTLRDVDLSFLNETFDCDNYSDLYINMFHLACGLSGHNGSQAAIAQILVNQNENWAGVPAGGNHALVALAVALGEDILILVVEPQVPYYVTFLDKYPNKIYRIKL